MPSFNHNKQNVQAICGTSLTNFAEKVKLKVEKLPEDVKIPEKHEEAGLKRAEKGNLFDVCIDHRVVVGKNQSMISFGVSYIFIH